MGRAGRDEKGEGPPLARSVDALGGFVFSPLAARLAEHPGPLLPLHVGDTWREPWEGARLEGLRADAEPRLHAYVDPAGWPPLREALASRVRRRNGLPGGTERVLVTAGATPGLAHAVGAVAEPGREVLVATPCWPLIRGIVRAQRARLREVPLYDRAGSAEEAAARVEARIGPGTAALYVSTPSNPTGRVLPAEWLERLAALARRRGLWILSDEVYEELVYRGEHVSIGRFAPERTLTAFSFSKAFALAGCRVGWLEGPPAAIAAAGKLATHSVYHAPTPAQWAGLRALEGAGAWLAEVREEYRRVGEAAAQALGLPPPEGSCFLFLDVRPALGPRGLEGFLEACLEEDGLVLAPGASCGEGYEGFVRLCYTALPPERMAGAVERLRRHLGGGPPLPP